MGAGADSATGRAMMRGLRRSIRVLDADELRFNLVEIRDRIDEALAVGDFVGPLNIAASEEAAANFRQNTGPDAIPWTLDAGHDGPALATGE